MTATSPSTPNQVTVGLSAGGAINVWNYGGDVDVIIDIVGYYQPSTSASAGAHGPKGDDGATGAQGPAGSTGADGAQGPKGEAGATGARGPRVSPAANGSLSGCMSTMVSERCIGSRPGRLR